MLGKYGNVVYKGVDTLNVLNTYNEFGTNNFDLNVDHYGAEICDKTTLLDLLLGITTSFISLLMARELQN